MAVRGGGSVQAPHGQAAGRAEDTRASSIRRYAARSGEGHSRLPRVSSVQRLVSKLKDPSPVVRFNALEKLIRLKSTESFKAVAGLLDDPHYMVRKEAVRGAGVLGVKPVFKKLVVLLMTDETPEVRGQAAKSITCLYPGKARDYLVTALKKERSAVALEFICDALSVVGRPEDIHSLVSLDGIEDDRLARRGCTALGEVGNLGAFPYLMQRINEPVYESASWAIAQIAGKSEENDRAIVDKLVADLQDGDPKKRENAAYVLGAMSSRQSFRWIMDIVSNASLLKAKTVGDDSAKVVEGAVYASIWTASSDVPGLLREWLASRSPTSDCAIFGLGICGDSGDTARIASFLGDERQVMSEGFMGRALYWEFVRLRDKTAVPDSISRSLVAEIALHDLSRRFHDEVLTFLVRRYNMVRASNPELRDALLRVISRVHRDYLSGTPSSTPAEAMPLKSWGRESFEFSGDQMGLTELHIRPREKLRDLEASGFKLGKNVSKHHFVGEGEDREFCFSTSFHMHTEKDVGIKVFDGKIMVLLGHGREPTILEAGKPLLTIKAGVPHQIINIGDVEAVIVESESPARKDNIIRFDHPYAKTLQIEGY